MEASVPMVGRFELKSKMSTLAQILTGRFRTSARPARFALRNAEDPSSRLTDTNTVESTGRCHVSSFPVCRMDPILASLPASGHRHRLPQGCRIDRFDIQRRVVIGAGFLPGTSECSPDWR